MLATLAGALMGALAALAALWAANQPQPVPVQVDDDNDDE